MPSILFVRITSELGPDEMDRRLLERRPRFLEVPGLVQKIYGRDPSTGDVCGIYFFDSRESLSRFRASELAETIGKAYQAVELRREAYDLIYPLRPGRGPYAEAGTGAER